MAPVLAVLLVSIAHACPSGATCGSGWSNTDRVFTGTQHTHIPAGVAIGTYSPNQDVYLAIDWKDFDTDNQADHQMDGLTEHCTNASCSSFSQTTLLSPFGSWDVTDGPIAPSLEPIFVSATQEVQLRLLGQSDDGSTCSPGPEVDYFTDWFFDDWTDISAGNETVSTDSCDNYGHGTLAYGGFWTAGWTRKPTNSSTSDQAMFSRYSSGAWVTPTELQDDGGQSDHAAITYNGSAWVAGFHDFQAADITLEVDPGVFVVRDIPTGGSSPNWPSLQIAGSVWMVGWVEPSGGDGNVYLSTCSSSCMGTGTWTTSDIKTYSHPDAGVDIIEQSFFELLVASDGDDSLHALWQDKDSTSNHYRRVMYSEKCSGGSWTTPVEILAESVLPFDSLELGRPHMVLDQENHVAHVAFVEKHDWNDFASGAVVWGRHQWTCP